MLLSIIIPCYNVEDYLPECLDSVLHQNLNSSEHEIIIVNDGSNDTSLKIAKNYAARHSNMIIIDKKNAGLGAARNSGFDIAKGKYVYFLDSDDYLAKNTISYILNLMESNNLEILTFNCISVLKKHIPYSTKIEHDTIELDVQDGVTYIANTQYSHEVWRYLIKREFIIDRGIRFTEGVFVEDAYFTTKSFLKAQRMAHIDYDIYRYRLRPTSILRNKTPEHYNKLIHDNANLSYAFSELINTIPKEHINFDRCFKRLKTRQQSFVFFSLVRLMKSNISTDKIPNMLEDFEKIDAYPLKKFLGEDYHGITYSILVFIFNRKYLIKPFITVFRTFYKFVK